ncbi:MAG: ACP S-malonyltransferase [Roseiflexaceae bacterium]|nr:ACP S-malonyltransferase [Roseiflexaceae bacterium]
MRIALIFPGQGSQVVGMGREVYAASAAARGVFEQADATLGFALTQLCFEGPELELTATENAQPALLTVSVALLAALAANGTFSPQPSALSPQPSALSSQPSALSPQAVAFVAGHSLGEYAALVAAGALDFPTALRLVRRRGELMAEADQGAMAAIIGLDEGPLEDVCQVASQAHGPVVIANYNAPGQLVISGTVAGVAAACAEAKQRGAKRALPLKVSAAFHSPLMQAAADRLAPLIAAAELRDALVPLVGNVSAQPISAADDLRRELVAQITAPVRWIASVQAMLDAGVTSFVEVGAGSVLTGLVKRIAPSAILTNISTGGEHL